MKNRSRPGVGSAFVAVAVLLAAAGCGGGDAVGEDKGGGNGPLPEEATGGTGTVPADLNGTYRYVLTQADADKAGDKEPQDFPCGHHGQA